MTQLRRAQQHKLRQRQCLRAKEGWIYCPPAVVAGGVPSGISSEHGWAFATQVAGGYLLNDTNKTQKQSRLMSVIPSDHLNAHILGEEQPPTHPFSHTLSKYGEQCGRCTLEKKVRIDLGAGSAKQKPQSQMSQSPGTAGKSRGDAVRASSPQRYGGTKLSAQGHGSKWPAH